MSIRYVKIYYGPNEAFYTVCHKPQKLRGLRARDRVQYVLDPCSICLKKFQYHIYDTDNLQKLGFRVDLVPVEFINLCVLEMCGHEVFRCNIANLSFNAARERDAVCARAVSAVLEGSIKFVRARDHLWAWALLDRQIFRRNEFAPKDRWPERDAEDAGPRGRCGCPR